MIEYVNIDDIKPAAYNPRKITESQIETLKESIHKIGLVIPILVNKKNNVILAGHQRTKASRTLGVKKVPVIYVEDMAIGDEIKFNQIHNITDTTADSRMILIAENKYLKEKYIEIENADISEGKTVATCVKEICKLMVKYGNVLSCVICNNQVLMGREYVKACKLLNQKVNAYICDDEKYALIKHYFNEQYGEYYYKDIEKKTYVQGLAQMFRNSDDTNVKKGNKSKLYETMVLPYLKSHQDATVLDFGCGKGEYINKVKKKHKGVGLEFYNNNGSKINVTKGNKMIDDLINFIIGYKRFDVVVCDSVINSVDSVKAEQSIYTLLNLFTKEKMFISGRPLDRVLRLKSLKKDVGIKNKYLEFLDDDNFTANYRKGQWYYQHFHEKDKIINDLKSYGFEIVSINWGNTSFQIECNKVEELDIDEYIQAIDFEFNLPLPHGKTYNRQDDVKRALGLT